MTLNRTLRHVLVAASVSAAVLTTTASTASAAPAAQADQPGIQVLHNDVPAVTFDKAKCQVARKHGKMQFKATSKSHGWTLDVRLNDFGGYGATYNIQYGMGVNNFYVTSPADVRYTNIFSPDFPFPASGGAAAFPGGKKKVLGLGFIAAFSATGSVDGSDGVTLGGRATCSYKKKR